MGVLADWQIEQIAKAGAIKPFADGRRRAGKISYGLSAYGYDARVGFNFKIFTPALCACIDPKNFDSKTFVDVSIQEGESILIPPNSFCLAETIEWFEIPRDCIAICLGKSSYARCGIVLPMTPLEPEWKGKVTVEISNTTPLPAKVYAGEGIMQVLFFQSAGVIDIAIRTIGRMLEPGPTGYNKQLEEFFVSIMNTKRTCRVSYADKDGKYQNQEGLTLPEVDKVDTKKT